MSKALEYFEEMKECNQLDYQDEKPKCDLIESELKKAERFEKLLLKWYDLLSMDGTNTKAMVRNDIQHELRELHKEL